MEIVTALTTYFSGTWGMVELLGTAFSLISFSVRFSTNSNFTLMLGCRFYSSCQCRFGGFLFGESLPRMLIINQSPFH